MRTKEIEVKIKCDISTLVRDLKTVNKELDKIKGTQNYNNEIFIFCLGMIVGILLCTLINIL